MADHEMNSDVGLMEIGDKKGSIIDSADADETAGQPQASKRPKKTSDGSSGIAPRDSDLANFLESEKFLNFLSDVQDDPSEYKFLRYKLERTDPDLQKILSKYPSRNDPLLDAITVPRHANFRFIQSEQFQKFRSDVLAEPHMYKNMRKKFDEEENYYDGEMQYIDDPLRDELLVEIIKSITYGRSMLGFEKRLQIVRKSKEVKAFLKRMKDDPKKYTDHIKVLLKNDPFVTLLIGWDMEDVDEFKEISFGRKLLFTDHSDPESPAYIAEFGEMLKKNPGCSDDDALFYLYGRTEEVDQ